MPTRLIRQAYWQGVRDGAPHLLVVVPFGLLFGAVAAEAGWSLAEIMATSFLVIAGASQFTALQLISENAPTLIVIGTALAVNLRMAMYSAALAPHLGPAPLRQRMLAAYFLTDQTYGAAISRYALQPGMTVPEKVAHFFGVATPVCAPWYLASWAGGGGRRGDPRRDRPRLRRADHLHRAVRPGAARPAAPRGGDGLDRRRPRPGLDALQQRRSGRRRRGDGHGRGARGLAGGAAVSRDASIWMVIGGLGLGTYLIRLSFIGLVGGRAFPGWATRLLRFVPVAVMPAIVAPLVAWPAATGGSPDAARIAAAAVAQAVGAWRRDVLAAILAGMAALYLGLWLGA